MRWNDVNKKTFFQDENTTPCGYPARLAIFDACWWMVDYGVSTSNSSPWLSSLPRWSGRWLASISSLVSQQKTWGVLLELELTRLECQGRGQRVHSLIFAASADTNSSGCYNLLPWLQHCKPLQLCSNYSDTSAQFCLTPNTSSTCISYKGNQVWGQPSSCDKVK